VKQSNLKGTVTFATSGPNSRTTQVPPLLLFLPRVGKNRWVLGIHPRALPQLFINLGDNTNLDGMGFSPFGKVLPRPSPLWPACPSCPMRCPRSSAT
jgi:hypothetical protein